MSVWQAMTGARAPFSYLLEVRGNSEMSSGGAKRGVLELFPEGMLVA